MACLRLWAAIAALAAAVPAHAASPLADPPQRNAIERWGAEIAAASSRCGVPAGWIERVMRAESAGQTMLDGRPIVSRAGAMGLMQLMPATWADMRSSLALGSDPHEPADNIVAGACYLRLMYDRFGYPGLFGAYNAGPGRYAAWLAGTSTLPGETRAYLASATGGQGEQAERVAVARPAPVPPPLFVALRTVSVGAPASDFGAAADRARAGLFLIER